MSPRFAEALLRLAGDAGAEYIAGDLQEEFVLARAEMGSAAAARWYAWQFVRSLARPLGRRMLGAALVLALPLAAFDRLWALVFAQLCQAPASGLLAVNGVCLCAGALWVTRSRRVVGCLLGAGLATGLAIGPDAFPHIIAGLLAVPAGVLAAVVRKAIA
jgi:hypothetical protein